MKATSKQNGGNTWVKVIAITEDGVQIALPQGEFLLPYSRVPWFRDAKISDVLNDRLDDDDNTCIRWDALDVDLGIDSILYPEKYPLLMKRYIGEQIKILAAVE